MLKAGNGAPARCIYNLMRIVRGENPYERLKGFSRELIDRPVTLGANEYLAALDENAATYEPRAALDLDATARNLANGEVDVSVVVTEETE